MLLGRLDIIRIFSKRLDKKQIRKKTRGSSILGAQESSLRKKLGASGDYVSYIFYSSRTNMLYQESKYTA